jgi:DNA-binding response OmpR family regulator
MNTRILIVDDETDLLEVLSMNLDAEGYAVTTAASGTEALASIQAQKPDLILLDIMLGDMSGVQMAARLKNTPETADIPIIMLTAKDSETDMIVGLSVGADDYITKPFNTKVLVARIEAVLRRASPVQKDVREILSVGPLKIIPAARQVLVNGKDVELAEAEYNILLALVKAGGDILSRDDLRGILGTPATNENERIVDVHVGTLRNKLGKAKKIVKTVYKRGYRLNT